MHRTHITRTKMSQKQSTTLYIKVKEQLRTEVVINGGCDMQEISKNKRATVCKRDATDDLCSSLNSIQQASKGMLGMWKLGILNARYDDRIPHAVHGCDFCPTLRSTVAALSWCSESVLQVL